ncbi:lytic transglycosylase domain-containing protein [Brevundimonas sp. NPDC003966]|uniref:lytic transglycosylase domain-containing protein n=1 Tax=unclassified Brevundimonas TaxID=2622653 RepID=UPI0036736D3B
MSARSLSGRGVVRAAAVGLALATTGFPGVPIAFPAVPEPRRQAPAGRAVDDLIIQAASRFGLPPHWIRAVMKQESGFNPRATSRAGAMGLMQIMPATYEELRRWHGLGADPYDPRDNIMAGAAYLRELHDRFGLQGMLPAYNAGPRRYLEHRDKGRPLPLETRDYVARIGFLDRMAASPAAPRIMDVPAADPHQAPLFPDMPQSSGHEGAGLFPVSAPAAGSDPVLPR